mgnify:CR=1 FL=1
MYEKFGISKKLEELSIKVENELKEQFAEIDRICEINSMKVLKAFQFPPPYRPRNAQKQFCNRKKSWNSHLQS